MEYASGNIFIREMKLSKGEVVSGHTHNFDHVTYVAHGCVRITQSDTSGKMLASVEKRAADGHNWVLIEAGKCHEITALEEAVCHCIYAHRNPQGEIVQQYDGWMNGYV